MLELGITPNTGVLEVIAREIAMNPGLVAPSSFVATIYFSLALVGCGSTVVRINASQVAQTE